jgi:nucleotide-binding universal stress UspA family protein
MAPAAGLFPKILVPVDFSECSEEAFRKATALGRLFQSDIVLLHVIDTKSLTMLNTLGLALPSEEAQQKKRLRHQARVLAERFLTLEEAKGLTVRREIVEGSPFVEIVRMARAEKADLVVMGSYGGFASSVEKIFFGSTAERVVRTAGCPVLCVPLAGKPLPKSRPI